MDKKNHKAEKNSAENQNENKAQDAEKTEEKGIIYGTGVYHAGEIKNTKCMQEAYEMGKNV